MKILLVMFLGLMMDKSYSNPQQQQTMIAQQMAQQNQQSEQQAQRALTHQGMKGNVIERQEDGSSPQTSQQGQNRQYNPQQPQGANQGR